MTSPVSSPAGQAKVPQCHFCDVAEVQSISQILLYGLAGAAVEKTAGKMFQNANKAVVDVKKALLEYLNKTSEAYEHSTAPPGRPSEIVEGMIEDFISGKRSMMGRIAGGRKAKKDERTEAVVIDIEKQGIWPADRREYLAEALIARIDKPRVFHCGTVFATEDEAIGHRAQCRFRPVTCPNQGCGQLFSAMHLPNHDAICVHKPVPCTQGCSFNVPRHDMQQHCATKCDKRVMQCPFQRAGCTERVFQGDLMAHGQKNAPQHLLLLYQAQQGLEGTISNQTQRVGLVEESARVTAKTLEVEVKNLKLLIKELDSKVKSLEDDNKKLHKEVKNNSGSMTGELSQLKRDLKAMTAVRTAAAQG